MDIAEFVEQSLGRWRSQRSAHHLAFSHFEAVTSIKKGSEIIFFIRQ